MMPTLSPVLVFVVLLLLVAQARSYGLIVEPEVESKGPGELAEPDGDLDITVRVKAASWIRADLVTLCVNGVKVRQEEIQTAANAALTGKSTWRLPRPSHDAYLVAIARGPGMMARYWRPPSHINQRRSSSRPTSWE